MNLFKDIPSGDNPPEEINVVVDIPKGSHNKYEYNEEEGYFELDRTFYSPLYLPCDYGFIPQTRSEDGDSLDVLLINSFPTFSGCVIKARPIGVMFMEDEKGTDNKIIALPKVKIDPRFKEVSGVEDLPEHLKKEIQAFFEDYKKLEPGKFVKVKGWAGLASAEEIINESVKRYKNGNNNK